MKTKKKPGAGDAGSQGFATRLNEAKSTSEIAEGKAIDFLQGLRHGGPWLIIAIDPNGKGIEGITASTAKQVDEFIAKFKERWNLYYSVNPTRVAMNKKAEKTDIASIEYLLADLDPKKGEAPKDAKERYLNAIETISPKPTAIVDSGNGIQALWRLAQPIDLTPYAPVKDGKGKWELSPEAKEIVDRAESYSATMMKLLGCDDISTRNIDRILRIPETINFPTAPKLKAGKEKCPTKLIRMNGGSFPLTAFPDPIVIEEKKAKPQQHAQASIEIEESIAPDDLRLKGLSKKWIDLGFKGEGIAEYAAKNGTSGRSEAAIGFACECFRVGLDENLTATCLMRWKIGDHIRDSSNINRTLKRILDKAKEFVEDSKLFEMNEKHFVLPIAGKTRVATRGPDPDFPNRITIVSFSSLNDFKSLFDKYRYNFIGEDKDGNPEEITMGLGSWWAGNPNRRQYDGGMRFMPNSDEDVVNETLNLWTGFAVAARKPEGKSGAAGCSLLLDHGLKIICSGNEEHFAYMMKREALIAQKRIRSEIAIGLHTEEEGTGKGIYASAFRHLYGVHGMQVQKPEHVVGKHNAHLESLLRLTADEALFAGDPRQRNSLYNLITEPTLTIEPKFIGVYRAPNFLNIDVISNAAHFLPVGGTARRFMVPTVSSERMGDHEYFDQIQKQLTNEGGYEALLYHLLNEIDIRDFNVRDVPKTAGLLEQKLSSTDQEQGWWLDMLMNGDLPQGCDQPDTCPTTALYDAYIVHVQKQGGRRRMNQTAFGMFLNKVVPGLTKVKGTVDGRQMRVYLFPPLKVCRAEFAKLFQQPIDWPEAEAEWTGSIF